MCLLPPPSLSTVAPWYVNSSTSSTSSPSTTIFSLILAHSVLNVLLFLALSLSPTLAAYSANLLVFSCRSLNLDDRVQRVRKSAKSRSSSTVMKFHLIPLLSCLLLPSSWPNPSTVRIGIPTSRTQLDHKLVRCHIPIHNCALKSRVYVRYDPHHFVWYPITSHDIP